MATPALLALALAWQATNSDPIVSYEAMGLSAPRVVRELSEQFGQKLACSPSLADEPLIIKVENVRLSELREKIALAIRGKWSLDSDKTLRLLPLPKESEADRVKRVAVAIRKKQLEVRRQLEKQVPFDAKAAKQMAEALKLLANRWRPDASEEEFEAMRKTAGELVAKSPYEQFAKRLFVELPAEELARVTWMRRMVWAPAPTRRQLRLPARAIAALRTFFAEIAVWETAGGTPPTTDFALLDVRLFDLLYHFEPPEETSRLRPAPLSEMEILVEATGYGDGDNELCVRFFGLGMETRVIDFTPSQWTPETESPTKRLLAEKQDAKLALSDLAMAIARRASGATMHTTTYERPGIKEEEFLLDPEKNDPCSLVLPDVFIAVGKLLSLNVVVVPNDGVYSVCRRYADGMTTAKTLEPLLVALHNLEISKDGTWLIGSPRMQLNYGTGGRVSRLGLGNVIRRIRTEDMLTIDAAAEYAYRHLGIGNWAFSRVQQFLSLYRGDQRTVSSDDPDGTWLWLYGSLDGYQWRDLKEGKTLRLADLRPDQVSAIRDHVYSGAGQLWGGASWAGNDSEFENPLNSEPTILWPVDIPADGRLSLTEKPVTAVLGFGTRAGMPYSRSFDAEQLAIQLELQKDGDLNGYRFHTSHFKMLKGRTVTLRVQLDDQYHIEADLSEKSSPSGRELTWNELPQSFLDEVESYRKQLQEAPPPVGQSVQATARTSRSVRSPSL